ncbi:MAG: putative DNA binding domain-containing protein [Anaerolineales bacterium]|nr:putative DNA binding domain-containing protein [Anaerolineales bacterium]
MAIYLESTPEIIEGRFRDLATPEGIAELLELSSLAFLKYCLYTLPQARRYRTFTIPKRSGGERIILEPEPNLKIIQQKLLQVLTLVYQPKRAVHGFVDERSIVTNASPHINRRAILNVDLLDFFPSIHFGRVRGMFMAFPFHFNDKVATILAQICSLPHCLPQGAPTSPIIANLICAKMDSQLTQLARTHHCYYTRYADDLTFSTSLAHFPKSLATIISEEGERTVEIREELARIIHKNGFRINPKKVRLQTRDHQMEVTGLVVNRKVNVKRSYIRHVRAILHAWQQYGYQAAADEYFAKYFGKAPDKPYKTLPGIRQVIKGKLSFIAMVRGQEDHLYIRYNNQAAQLERRDLPEPHIFRILAEPDNAIVRLVAEGESVCIEFKVGACLNPHTNKQDKKMKDKIVRAVASMINSLPVGHLLIGVKDNGEIIGVEREFPVADSSKQNRDGYELYLANILNDSLQVNNAQQLFTITFHNVGSHTVCQVQTTKSMQPVLVNNQLFIRSQAQTRELSGQEMVEYIQQYS